MLSSFDNKQTTKQNSGDIPSHSPFTSGNKKQSRQRWGNNSLLTLNHFRYNVKFKFIHYVQGLYRFQPP